MNLKKHGFQFANGNYGMAFLAGQKLNVKRIADTKNLTNGDWGVDLSRKLLFLNLYPQLSKFYFKNFYSCA